MTEPTKSGRAATILVAALLGGLLAGAVAWSQHDPQGFADSVPSASALPENPVGSPGRGSSGQGSSGPAGTPAAPSRPTTPPRELRIPRLGITLPIVADGVDEQGAMALPESAYELSWYRFGSGPLSPQGATVIAGHVDTKSEGTGPLAQLAGAREGDRIEVRVGGKVAAYEIDSVRRIGKAVLNLPSLFSRTGRPRLHLVTCGGDYLADRGGYQDNVVVIASPLPG